MVATVAVLVSLAVVAVLLVAGWMTERRRTPGESGPTLAEHAATDAGRVGAAGLVGPHDATMVGTPTRYDQHVLGDR